VVDFSGYEVKRKGPYLEGSRLTLGGSTWKRITRGMVGVLIGAEV
jgi:hypothetical protein